MLIDDPTYTPQIGDVLGSLGNAACWYEVVDLTTYGGDSWVVLKPSWKDPKQALPPDWADYSYPMNYAKTLFYVRAKDH